MLLQWTIVINQPHVMPHSWKHPAIWWSTRRPVRIQRHGPQADFSSLGCKSRDMVSNQEVLETSSHSQIFTVFFRLWVSMGFGRICLWWPDGHLGLCAWICRGSSQESQRPLFLAEQISVMNSKEKCLSYHLVVKHGYGKSPGFIGKKNSRFLVWKYYTAFRLAHCHPKLHPQMRNCALRPVNPNSQQCTPEAQNVPCWTTKDLTPYRSTRHIFVHCRSVTSGFANLQQWNQK